jgi:group I intron endonuclease
MRLLKSHPILRLANSYLIDSPQPVNLSYLWNFGSLLAFCLIIQIVTGVTLAMHYNPSVTEAFNSVEHIMRDVNNGWLIRYLHSNTASFFFFLVYLHIGRGMYYGSYRAPRTLVWTIGTVIFLLMMATGFLGYINSPKWFKLIFLFIENNFVFSFFLFLLTIHIVSKLCIYIKVRLTRSNLLSKYINNKLECYLNKIIHLNKNFSTVYIWLILILLLGTFLFSVYECNKLYTNLDNFISVHNIKQEIITLNLINLNRFKFSMFQSSYKQIKHNSTFYKNNNLISDFLKEKNLTPILLYENLDLDTTKKAILKDTKNTAGIYLIFNKITGNYYVGSASTNRFYARFSNHLLYFRGSKVLKHAVNKYKLSNFAFMILELFPEVVNKENNKKLLDMEDFYLKSLLPNYNILTEAGSSFGYKHTEVDRIKMKINYSADRRKRIGDLNRNKNLSETTRLKLRESALSRKNVSFSKQALLNMKKKSKPIILYNLDRTVFGEYPSIVEAARSINCDEKTIRRALTTEKKILKRRFIIKYVKNN